MKRRPFALIAGLLAIAAIPRAHAAELDLDYTPPADVLAASAAYTPPQGYVDVPEGERLYQLKPGDNLLSELPDFAVVNRGAKGWQVIQGDPAGSTLVVDARRRWAVPMLILRDCAVRWKAPQTYPAIYNVSNTPMRLIVDNVYVQGWYAPKPEDQQTEKGKVLYNAVDDVFKVDHFELVTDARWRRTINGPKGAGVVQRTWLDDIPADALTNVGDTRNVIATRAGVGAADSGAHSDIMQLYGGKQGVRVAGLWVRDSDAALFMCSKAELGPIVDPDIRDVDARLTGSHKTQFNLPTVNLSIDNLVSNQSLLFGLPHADTPVAHEGMSLSQLAIPPPIQIEPGVTGVPDVELLEPPAELEDVVEPQPEIVLDRAKLIHWFNAGWSSSNEEARNLGRGLPRDGWAGYVGYEIRPVLEAGCRRIGIHNPFGANAGEPMDFDQAVEIVEQMPEHRHLHPAEFVRAWKPVVEGAYTGGQPVEVIAYIGDLDGDADMVALRDAADGGDFRAEREYQDRVYVSVQPFLEAGCSLGLDSSTGFAEGGVEMRVLRRLEAAGVRVYIEAWPSEETPWLHGRPTIVRDSPWYEVARNRVLKGNYGLASYDQVGEVIRLIHPRKGESWDQLNVPDAYRARAASIVAEGDTPAGDFRLMLPED